MRARRLLAAAVALVAGPLVAPASALAAADTWSPLQEAADSTLAVAVAPGTVALVSTGGPDGATVYDQRRTAAGDGPRTEVMTVDGAEQCRPVEAATASGDVAVAVECRTVTDFEEPPTRLVLLAWTRETGWEWRVQREGVLASIDHSPQGQYVLFATDSRYGRPHHLTSFHPDLGWRDLTRAELDLTGDDLVAAIDDSGDVVALRGSGSEDEPGYWFGGRLRIDRYDDRTGAWTRRFSRAYPGGGIAPGRIDLTGRRIVASAVESRSTGELDGRADRVLLIAGTPRRPRLWSPARWSRDVRDASAGVSAEGTGVAAWLAVGDRRSARPWVATWPRSRRHPVLQRLGTWTSLTGATAPSGALDLSVAPDGHGVVASVRHRRGQGGATVTATSFVLSASGRLGARGRTAWEQPADATVDVTAGTDAASLTIGRLSAFAVPSPLVQYAVLPWS